MFQLQCHPELQCLLKVRALAGESELTVSTLWKGRLQLSEPLNTLELHAQSASERPEGGNQHRTTVLRIHRDITLSEEVVAIGYGLPVARSKFGQRLAHTHMEERNHLEERLAIGVQTRYRFAADPLVTGVQLRTAARQLCGNSCSERIVHGVTKHVARGCVHDIGRAKGARVRVYSGDFR